MPSGRSLVFISVAVIALVFAGCSNASGPCDYEINNFRATVKAIESYQKNDRELFHVVLEFDKSNLAEKEQYLDELKGFEIDSGFIARNNLRVGDIYQGTVSEVISGRCTPLIISFENRFKTE